MVIIMKVLLIYRRSWGVDGFPRARTTNYYLVPSNTCGSKVLLLQCERMMRNYCHIIVLRTNWRDVNNQYIEVQSLILNNLSSDEGLLSGWASQMEFAQLLRKCRSPSSNVVSIIYCYHSHYYNPAVLLIKYHLERRKEAFSDPTGRQ